MIYKSPSLNFTTLSHEDNTSELQAIKTIENKNINGRESPGKQNKTKHEINITGECTTVISRAPHLFSARAKGEVSGSDIDR